MASTIKVDNVQNQPGTNIINKCSTTITIGASSDTIALAAGASQTGFGREGSVDWQTGSIKTGTFTAVTGEGYFVNTSGGVSTVNLPAGAAGSIVAVSDYTRTWNSNNVTVTPNGAEKIGGVAAGATLDVNGQSATFVYVDGTEGWINVQETQTSQAGIPPFMEATGGTITESGDFKIHTFTGSSTFEVTRLATQSPAPIYNIVSYAVAAGGGGSGGAGPYQHTAGGGGGGGFREGKNAPVDSYTASPLNAPAGLPVSLTSYPITVGGGGAGGVGPAGGSNGLNSVFSTITSTAGGGGAAVATPGTPACRTGKPGGSGGGGSSQTGGAGGSGNTPPTSPSQGNTGGPGTDAPPDLRGGAGGGATAIGGAGSPVAIQAAGAAGATTNIPGSPLGYSGGGGAGGTCVGGPGAGGAASPCGSGAAGSSPCAPNDGNNAVDNRGGGGGGAGAAGPSTGGNGGSGVVIIRYKFQ